MLLMKKNDKPFEIMSTVNQQELGVVSHKAEHVLEGLTLQVIVRQVESCLPEAISSPMPGAVVSSWLAVSSLALWVYTLRRTSCGPISGSAQAHRYTPLVAKGMVGGCTTHTIVLHQKQ